MRTAILQLRSDPKASAMLAGALTRNNAALVSSSIGRQPSNGELYIAHFLGADGAGKLINGASKHPRRSAAAMFPHAAAANHTIFYDSAGRARSVGEVYGRLTRLFDSARDIAFAQRGTADTDGVAQSAGAPPLPPPVTVRVPTVKGVPAERALRVASAAAPMPPAPIPTPDTAGMTEAFARASETLPPPPAARPSFESMFADRVNRPLAPTVSNLWGAAATTSSQSQKVQVFDLFTDTRPNERKLLGDKA